MSTYVKMRKLGLCALPLWSTLWTFADISEKNDNQQWQLSTNVDTYTELCMSESARVPEGGLKIIPLFLSVHRTIKSTRHLQWSTRLDNTWATWSVDVPVSMLYERIRLQPMILHISSDCGMPTERSSNTAGAADHFGSPRADFGHRGMLMPRCRYQQVKENGGSRKQSRPQ